MQSPDPDPTWHAASMLSGRLLRLLAATSEAGLELGGIVHPVKEGIHKVASTAQTKKEGSSDFDAESS